MIDDEARQSLEQEAIALVNLSNSAIFASTHEEGVSPAARVSGDAAGPTLDASMELLEGTISMKSLLGTLKKRKSPPSDLPVKKEQSNELTQSDPALENAEDADSAKLPSFRTVFQRSQQETEDVVPSLIKCKYRTGKCHNMRALKSCGDYHNLCNYHRLRANANQRKLDRKKKEQRLQQQLHTNTALSSPLTVVQPPLYASSHAAAAALASLVVAHPHHHLSVLQQQRPFFTVPEVRKPSSTSVRPKEEDACSY